MLLEVGLRRGHELDSDELEAEYVQVSLWRSLAGLILG